MSLVPTWIEINREALFHNYDSFRNILGVSTKLCAVVKSNAYGHGLREIVSALLEKSPDYWAVNSLDEAITVRSIDKNRPILLMGFVSPERYSELVKYEVSCVISSLSMLEQIGMRSLPIRFHLKVDTGMGRLGLAENGILLFIEMLARYPNMIMEGVMSHFANAEDVLEQFYAKKQLQLFENIKKSVIDLTKNADLIFHIAASAATIVLPESHYGMVRIGIGLYGLWPSHETRLSSHIVRGGEFTLNPVLTWKSRLVSVKEIPSGCSIGYGCTYRLKRNSIVGVVPVGYYEGYSRALSDKAFVIIRGLRCPVIGRVCMNMFMVDLTDLGKISIHEEVVLVGKSVTIDDYVSFSGLINYEIVTKIHESLLRKII